MVKLEKKGDIDKEILNYNGTPFMGYSSTKKSTKLKVFVGRQDELRELGKLFTNVNEENGIQKAIILKGPSGVGKTTLVKRLFDLVEHNQYSELGLTNFIINISWIEKPSNPSDFSYKYLYSNAMQDFNNPLVEKGYEIIRVMVKLINDNKITINLNSDEKKIIEDLYFKIYNNNEHVQKLFLDDYKEQTKDNSNYYRFMNIVDKNTRNIRRLLKKKYDIDLGVLKNFFKCANPNSEIADEMKDKVEGHKDSDFLKLEDDFKNYFKNTINIHKWIYSNIKSVMVIIIDGLEYYTSNEEYNYVFKFLLSIRDGNFKNFVLILTGTDQFWNDFMEFIEEKKSGRPQFKGFIGLDLALDNLTKDNTIKVIEKYLNNYYSMLHLSSGQFLYPFSKEVISYLYYLFGGNIRLVLEKLKNHWIKFFNPEINKVLHVFNRFEALKYFREWQIDDPLVENRLKLYDADLEILCDFFENIKEFSTTGDRSTQVEEGLVLLLEKLRDNIPEIAEVFAKSKKYKILGKIIKPDVTFNCFGDWGINEQRRVEIQVKTYEPKNFVKKKDVETSITLLTNNKIDYLRFLTTSPLHDKLIRKLQEFGARVGGLNPLNKIQKAYLTLILPKKFHLIFGREMKVEECLYFFSKIFNISSFNYFLDYLRLLPRNENISSLKVDIQQQVILDLQNKYKQPAITAIEMAQAETSKKLIIEPITKQIEGKVPFINSSLIVQNDDTEQITIEREILNKKQQKEIVPENKLTHVRSILKLLNNRAGRLKNRGTIKWIAKELLNDFPQEKTKKMCNWMKEKDIKLLQDSKQSVELTTKGIELLETF